MVIAVLASSLPVIVEPAPTVAADPARTTPLKLEVAPTVRAVSSCQNIFSGTAPPVKDALVFAPVINQRELAESIHH